MPNEFKPILNFFSSRTYSDFAPLVIFDRDDTLIKDKRELRNVSHIEWLPGRLETIRSLGQRGIRVAIATNQASIGRGAVKIHEYELISAHIANRIKAEGGELWAIATCPHNKEFENCGCRKPKPGLLDELTRAIEGGRVPVAFVGNADSDMEAARQAAWDINGFKIGPSESNLWEKIDDWVNEVSNDRD